MRLASCLAAWRVVAQRRRSALARSHAHRIAADARATHSATERCLQDELRAAELAAASTASHLLRRVYDERERRQSSEQACELSAANAPLALQTTMNQMREALQLEVIARRQAESKAQRLQRQVAALESRVAAGKS